MERAIPLKVLLADDHEMMRAGLRALLEQGHVSVVGEASNGRQAVEMALELRPDIVVMDVSMPELNGVEAARQLTAAKTNMRVVMLSMHSDRLRVVEALKAGAKGYVLKSSAAAELTAALNAVSRGNTYLSPSVADSVVDAYVRNPGQPGGTGTPLSTREREVLQLLAEGKTSKEMGASLHIAPKTVETHRAQISKKLGLHSVAELTKYAIRNGLTDPEV